MFVFYTCFDPATFAESMSLMESAKDSTTKESGSGSFFFGFGVGASVMAAAWATYEIKCAQKQKNSLTEPLM